MMWREQEQRVNNLRLLAGASAAKSDAIENRMSEWKSQKVRVMNTLAWAVAAGMLWGASPQPASQIIRAGRGLARMASAAWLVWGMLDRGHSQLLSPRKLRDLI